MTSDDAATSPPADAVPRAAADGGLLSPGSAGGAVEAATGDEAYVRAMLDAEVALVRAQARLGLVPAAAAEAVAAAAAGPFDARDLALRARPGGNPVIPLVADLTAAVRRSDPSAAACTHRGATSQDILDTATALVCSRALAHVLADLAATAGRLGLLAARHRATPMPGRTLTQHAVPTTFGLKAAGWRALVLDAYDRVAAARAGLPAQLGGAAGTLAAFEAFGAPAEGTECLTPGPEGACPAPGSAGRVLGLLAAFAAETGLREPELPWHTLRTPVADVAAALAFTGGALGALAADVLVLSRTEIGEVSEGAGGGSSAMPHKSNPVRAALIAAAARQLPYCTAALFGSMAAEDERPAGAWHAEWQPLREALRLAGGAARDARELAEGLVVRPDRMRANLGATGGLIVSERLAAVLAPSLGRAEAARLLREAARQSAEEGVALVHVLEDEPAVRAALPAARLRELADPATYIGAAPALTDRALLRGPATGADPGPAPTAPEEAP